MTESKNINFVKRYIICGGAAFLFFLLGLLFLNYVSVGTYEDDAIYVGLGSELVSHYQYRIPCFPSSPLCGKYPPLYPLLLGLFSLVFPPLPSGIPFLKAASLALAVPGIFFFSKWVLRRSESNNIHSSLAYLIVFIVASHAYLLFMSKELMSESLFLSLIMICLWKANAIEAQVKGKGINVRAYAWLFLLCALMFYTRSIGIVFILSLIAFVIYSRQIKWALVLGAAALVVVFPWFWWSRYWVPTHEPMAAIMPYFLSYNYHTEALRDFFFEEQGELLSRMLWYIKSNLIATIHGIEAMIFPSDSCHSPAFSITSIRIPSLLAIAFVCVGLFRSFRKGEYVSFFIIGYLLLVAAWPWGNKLRFMVPIAPILICYFVEGLDLLLSRHVKLRNLVLILFCSSILLNNLLWSFKINLLPSTLFVRTYGSESKSSDHKDALLQSIEWVKKNVPEDAIMLVGDGGLVYYVHTGRYILPYRTMVSSPSEHLYSLYDTAAYTRFSLLTPSVLLQMRGLYPDRQHYQLNFLSKKNLTYYNNQLNVTGVVFDHNEDDEKVIVVRRLFSPESEEKKIIVPVTP